MNGAVMGALPCGRKARIALTDGSVSAMPGSDVNGPTALATPQPKLRMSPNSQQLT